MCLYPKLIKNRKYTANKKNGGVIPAVTDKRVLWVPVGCGKCMECKKQKSRSWQVRLLEDIRENKNGKFVTLTFSNESIAELGKEFPTLGGYEKDNKIAKLGVRRFLERWRKKHKKSVRHWLVSELGHNGTENIHLHGIIWTDEPNDIKEIWKYGYTWEGTFVNEKTVNYIIKYVNKMDMDHKEYEPIVLTSAGIGSSYMKRNDAVKNKYRGKDTREWYKNRQGYTMNMPIYWRNKIYTDEEREKLWLQKLDKQVRFVNGRKIDISKHEEDYYRVLNEERIKNKELGYGDDKINWERRRYENDRRNANFKKRAEKALANQRKKTHHKEMKTAEAEIHSFIRVHNDINKLKDIW